MEVFNELFVRRISISGRGEEALFYDDMHIVIPMNFKFFPERRQMETAG
jgi:hypothetical protein